MEDLIAEVFSHFNEPMLCGRDLGRCVGYAEDEMDCYVVVNFPNGSRHATLWNTMVGGYTWLTPLKEQGKVVSSQGEEWDDLYRLDHSLEMNGCPKVDEFFCELRSTPSPMEREK